MDFLAVDCPHASPFLIQILVAVVEHQRNMISNRTKAALEVAKRRGVKLGNLRYDMRETIRNRKLEIIDSRETGSGNREVLRDKAGRILGRFENDTGITRDARGKIIGRGSSQFLRLLK